MDVSNMETEPLEIESYVRLKNSLNGNPTYTLITTSGHCYDTAKDASCAYGISGSNILKKGVRLTLNGRGKVTRIHLPNGETL